MGLQAASSGFSDQGYPAKRNKPPSGCRKEACTTLDDADLTPLLHKLITVTSLPLRSVETDFAIDSSGFSTTGTVTWFNTKFGHDVDNHDWIKLHLVTGVKTNTVTSATVSG